MVGLGSFRAASAEVCFGDLLPLQGLGHVGVEFGFLHPGHGGDLG